MIYLTGDCHGDFTRFKEDKFPDQKSMTKEDYVLICGDFGGIWNKGRESKEEANKLDWLNSLPFTTIFVCGNHENFDRLYKYPQIKWHGGSVHRIRSSVFHLMRGQVFELEGKTFFTFGGGTTHDVEDGILEPDDPDFEKKYETMKKGHCSFRVNHESWWKEEMPTEAEMREGRKNLSRYGNKVDYIITHSCSASTQMVLGKGLFKTDILTEYLEEIKKQCQYKKWYFGHYHADKSINNKELLIYKKIMRIS